MTLLPFDEMNVLSGLKRSIPIERYFDEMVLPKNEKADRKAFARKLENILFQLLAFLYTALEHDDVVRIQGAKDRLTNDIIILFSDYTYPDSAMREYIARYSNDFVDTTVKNAKPDKKAAYWFSGDRARYNAENETNTLFNYEQYRQAIADGMSHKQWITMKDERVRLTHAAIDDVVIGIDEMFQVGAYQARFPKDVENLGPEEYVSCRCTVRYF